MTSTQLTRQQVEDFLYREARLLDDLELSEWLTLFTEDGIYWVPIDETQPIEETISFIYDWGLRREERVRHLLDIPFPAQSPRSRTVHTVSNVEVTPATDGEFDVRSHQVIYEMRGGDGKQVGLGEVRSVIARVNYRLRLIDGEPKIVLKQVLMIDRDMAQSNLTFML